MSSKISAFSESRTSLTPSLLFWLTSPYLPSETHQGFITDGMKTNIKIRFISITAQTNDHVECSDTRVASEDIDTLVTSISMHGYFTSSHVLANNCTR